MQHDVLGEVQLADCSPFDAKAVVRHGLRDVTIGICRDDQTLEAALKLAAEVVARLTEWDGLAKRIATTDLRGVYNGGWNEYDEGQEDGSFKTVTNPQLSDAEFEAKLTLQSVNVTGDQGVDFFYDDERMFWGHSIVVSSFNGLDLREARADLFG